MRMTTSELIHAAYHAARYLPKASSQLMRELAERLDTTQAALCESLKIRDALAVERDTVNADNVYLRDQVLCWARECDRITYTHTNKITDAHQSEAEQELSNTVPATDAFLAEVLARTRREGVNFAAARLAAAFNHGFIDKPTAEVYDVVKAVLGAREELATAPDDGLSGEYAERALNDWAAQLRGNSNGGAL